MVAKIETVVAGLQQSHEKVEGIYTAGVVDGFTEEPEPQSLPAVLVALQLLLGLRSNSEQSTRRLSHCSLAKTSGIHSDT